MSRSRATYCNTFAGKGRVVNALICCALVVGTIVNAMAAMRLTFAAGNCASNHSRHSGARQEFFCPLGSADAGSYQLR